jgi:hypothetical protein
LDFLKGGDGGGDSAGRERGRRGGGGGTPVGTRKGGERLKEDRGVSGATVGGGRTTEWRALGKGSLLFASAKPWCSASRCVLPKLVARGGRS